MGTYAEALSVGISLVLGLIFYGLWRDFWVDEVRDDLFALRDDMFVYAYERNLLENDSYRLLRSLMNSVIRYSHEISGVRILMLAISRALLPQVEPAAFSAWREAMAGLSQLDREKLSDFHDEMMMLVCRQVFKTSMLLRAAAYILGVFLWLVRGNSDGQKELAERMPLDLLEQDALATARA